MSRAQLAEWPDWLPGIEIRPDEHHSRQRRPPEGVVLHCGDRGADLADAALRMSISYHFAWDVRPDGDRYVQLVSMQRRAWHASSEGNHWLGVALSGPAEQDPRDPGELEQLAVLLVAIREAFGGHLRWWCRHSDITPGKRDPGPGVRDEWVRSETGLVWRRAS